MGDAERGLLPTFVVIGAMKCGTTSLHHYIGGHPDAFVSDPKELDFFSDDAKFAQGVDWYRSCFDTTARVRGESSPNYMKRHLFPHAAERLVATLPDAQIVCMLRHPVDRLVSHYVHGVASGRETRPLATILAANDASTRNAIDTGRYYWQLEPYLSRIGRDRFWFGTSDDLASQHEATMASVLTFLGLDPGRYRSGAQPLFNTGARKMTRRRVPVIGRFMRAAVPVPTISAGDRQLLMEQFAPDIAALEDVVGRDLGWT
jgi:hypothetical protein